MESFRSVGFTHQLVNLVWQQCSVHWRDFQNASIVPSTDILEEWVSTLFVQGQQGRHVDFQRTTHRVDKGFRFNGKFTNFVDDEDPAAVSYTHLTLPTIYSV